MGFVYNQLAIRTKLRMPTILPPLEQATDSRQSLIRGFVGRMAVLQRPNSRLRPVRYLDLPQDRFHVDLDRRLGDVARARDHFIGIPLHETVENLSLALRQSGAMSQR